MTSRHPVERCEGNEDSRDERLAAVVAEYTNRLNTGEKLDIKGFAAQYPELNPELGMALEAFHEVAPAERSEESLGALGEYRIVRQVGKGGMGVIYEAWQASMDRRVALKVLPAGFLAKPKAIARFYREAKAAGRLHHPNIVSVHGTGVESGTPYFAMEFVEGETLEQILRRLRPAEGDAEVGSVEWRTWGSSFLSELLAGGTASGRFPGAGFVGPQDGEQPSADSRSDGSLDTEEINVKYCLRVAGAFAAVADGLEHAHQNGVIHRDLKPSNLILDQHGRLRVLDFGLARLEGQESLTASGDLLGTPLYMSPEQVRSSRSAIDHRTDIYSLGVTLYETLTWRPPFRGTDHHDTLSQIVNRDPPRLRRWNVRIPRDLETIVLKCLRKEPGHRYGTAEALAQDLRRFERGDPIEARPQSPWEKLRRRARKHRAWLAASTCLFLLCLTSGLLLHYHYREVAKVREHLYGELVDQAVMNLELGRAERRFQEEASREKPGEPWLHLAFHNVAHAASRDRALDPWPHPVEEAVEILEEAVSVLPSRPEAHYYLARARWLLGQRDEAIEALASALEGRPGFVPATMFREAVLQKHEDAGEPRPGDDWEEAWRRAHEAVAMKNWHDAVEAYNILVEANPREPEQPEVAGFAIEARMGKGRALLEAERLFEALESFGAAHAFWSDRLEPALLLAKTHLLLAKRYDIAETRAAAEARLVRFHSQALARDGVALRAAALYRECGEFEGGLVWAERLQKDNESREPMRADLLRRLGRPEEAAAAAERIVQHDRNDAKARNYLAVLLEDLGRLDEARTHYETALELEPELALTHYNLGGLTASLGKLEDAVRHYRKAIGLDPEYAPARNNLGLVLASQGKLAEAAEQLRRATTLVPDLPAPHSNLGIVLKEQGEFQEAVTQFEEALRLDETFAPAWDNLGEALRRMEKLDQAIEKHRKAIELDQSVAKFYNNLGIALLDKGQVDSAVEEFRKALARDGKLPTAHVNLGAALAKKRKYEEALAEFSRALELDPSLAQALFGRGKILARTGKLDEAIDSYRRGLEICERKNALDSTNATARRNAFKVLRILAQLATRARRLEEARNWGRGALAICRERAEQPDATLKDVHEYAWMLVEVEPPDLRDPQRALPLAEKAADMTEHKDPYVLDTLAHVSFLTGDAQRAVALEERALGLLAESDPARKHLEDSLTRFKKAREGRNPEKDR